MSLSMSIGNLNSQDIDLLTSLPGITAELLMSILRECSVHGIAGIVMTLK